MKISFFIFLVCLIYLPITHSACTFEKISNLRFGPGERYRIKWPLYKYTPLRIVKTEADWAEVEEFNKEKGWIERKYLTTEFYCAIVKVNHSPLYDNLKKPLTLSLRKNKAFHSDTFKFIETNKNRKWAHVKDDQDKFFWIKRRDIWVY